MSIAAAVLETLRSEAANHGGARVARAGLRIGELSGVEPESLRFCLETLVSGSDFDPLALAKHTHALVFATRNGTAPSIPDSERDFEVVCRRAGITGIRCSWNTLRHSFAVNYLRAGGNLYYLQRILGHSSITTTERCLRSLGIEDLQRVHDGLPLLSR